MFAHLRDDFTGAGDPLKRLWVLVVALDVILDCLGQVTNAASIDLGLLGSFTSFLLGARTEATRMFCDAIARTLHGPQWL